MLPLTTKDCICTSRTTRIRRAAENASVQAFREFDELSRRETVDAIEQTVIRLRRLQDHMREASRND